MTNFISKFLPILGKNLADFVFKCTVMSFFANYTSLKSSIKSRFSLHLYFFDMVSIKIIPLIFLDLFLKNIAVIFYLNLVLLVSLLSYVVFVFIFFFP